MDGAHSKLAHIWGSLKQYTALRSKLHLIILEQLEGLKELVEIGWSAREEILATKLKMEERQDTFISSTKSLSANLRDYDNKFLKNHAQKLELKDELDRGKHYEKEYSTYKKESPKN